ncbi:uncharacterized protein EI97DRAFT_142312 [Westerdykella ornata]|uniref:Uncharacterized protein n=1 Tax=Westerdykella ornata TaxID=318751 RepID=A0A6A6JCU8_WESOR|nr:uncharacterized protein EI97DRAFT_142312 [Westerdykella ornata]KAF2274003.1 hypothetical protein EI97DRAFT_142312 [Westerdykella ornata]
MYKHTAGIFLVSCSSLTSSHSTKLVANFLNEKPDARIFEEMAAGMPTLDTLSLRFRKKILERELKRKHLDCHQNHMEDPSNVDSTSVEVRFPVTQLVTRSEQTLERACCTDFLKLQSPKIVLHREFQDAIRFSSPWDNDFLHMMLLMDASFRTRTFLHSVVTGKYKRTRRMIQGGFNVNVQDSWGQSALHLAARKDDESMARLLLSRGRANPNIRDEALNTPLHYAVENNNATIVKELLAAGADINLKNNWKQTPKDLASSNSSGSRILGLLKSRLVEGPGQSLANGRLSNGTLPDSPWGGLACRNYQISVSEIFDCSYTDRHWTISVSVQQLLYSDSTLDEILNAVRPEPVRGKTPFCTWIHIPENNMIWVEDLFAKLDIHKSIWRGKAGPTSDSLRNRAIAPHVVKGEINSIFVPYISYESRARQERRSEYVATVNEEFERQRSTRTMMEQHALAGSLETYASPSPIVSSESDTLLNVPEMEAKSIYPEANGHDNKEISTSSHGIETDPHEIDEEEKGLIRTYLHNPASLHMRRTLDQYYYHMLGNTRERDTDQVVSRWAHNVKNMHLHNILMVDQLWLWSTRRAGNFDYVISSFPGRIGVGQSSHPSIDDLWCSVLVPENERRDPIH